LEEIRLDLSQLVHLIDEIPAYRALLADINKPGNGIRDALVLDAAKPYLIAAVCQKLQRPALLITAQPENAKKLFEQIAVWSRSNDLMLFSEPETLPYQRIITDFSVEQDRLQVLAALNSTGPKKRPPLVIASVPALLNKTASHSVFAAVCHTINTGSTIDPLALIGRWQAIGYVLENRVESPGTISRRGGIVDIFPPAADLPVRLEFFGNTVESIRLYDAGSQRSLKAINSIAICPAAEILFPDDKSELKSALAGLDLSRCTPEYKAQFEQDLARLAEAQRLPEISFYGGFFNSSSILDYLPLEAIVIFDDLQQIKEEAQYLDSEAESLREEKISASELPASFPVPYFRWDELDKLSPSQHRLNLLSWTSHEIPGLTKIEFNAAPGYAGQLPALIAKSKTFLLQGQRLIFISNQASRLAELFEEQDVFSQTVIEVASVPPPGSLTLVQGSLAEGWVAGFATVLTDKEIFGFVKERRLLKKRPAKHYKLLVDIKPGDYVVHIEHGIGQFTGIQNVSLGNTQKEYLVLSYAAGDKLYVPTDQIDRVSRYVGGGEDSPTLSRLGTQEWNRTKQKVKESVDEIAEDLLQLYATREVVQGHQFPPDTIWQRELEAAFPYVETPDQIKVQEEVKDDMSRTKPMDRLVVGDVGYGKTEIAIRAAFKAVMDNKQVAVLVPTTVLAEQHFVTFTQRMSTFPVKIEVLSRFRNPKDQKRVIDGLADGSVDICIGTHRMLQKDVVFKDLGLLVIDEEQRFGVSHKEYLKKMREQVDVLTLTATPIPRTLHMSLVGVRDMSVIETPPENRLPIKTYVAEYNERLVREAILRELERNGQVFFVHNRVQGISVIAERLKKLIPEASIDIAHGQMPEEVLEKVMLKFQQGEIDILVCTTIIESGLDLPNANTLIVNRADRFGLTQLYQLRGRIGRGSNLAYAYFLYDKESRLTPTAEKRLRTIFEATQLGAGFGIAQKDLEIRGAGSLLGTKQSGNISAVGFNLYTELLAQAVEEQKALRAGKSPMLRPTVVPETSIDLPLNAYLPEDYVTDVDMRLSVYQKLSSLKSAEQVDDLSRELIDRFGPLPAVADNLLYMVRLKTQATHALIEAISTNESIVTIRFRQGLQFNRKNIIPFYRYGIKIGISQIMVNLKRLGKDWPKILEELVKATV
jgi:transcription-repair coupling factor (superfamily II helicase)